MMGAIPIIFNETGMWPLYKEMPALVLDHEKTSKVSKKFLENFKMDEKFAKKSMKLLLVQYWFDKINSYRKVT